MTHTIANVARRGANRQRALRFVVVGAGMAGIATAIRLQELGFDFTVYEKADRVGGTWRENTYPGVACDVPSQLYSYSFAPNPEWSHVFSPGGEILDYLEDVAKKFGVLDAIRSVKRSSDSSSVTVGGTSPHRTAAKTPPMS